MDGKVPKTMRLRNKNAPKVLNSGTPEVSNHLVRMMSAVQIRPAALPILSGAHFHLTALIRMEEIVRW